jgi:hypothetical protein
MDQEISAPIDLYNRQRLKAIISRVRRPGGLPWGETQVERLVSWFRTLATRGYATNAFLAGNKVCVCQTFTDAYPNLGTRFQYVRAFLNYLQGLTDDEFAVEYPAFTRDQLMSLLNDVKAGGPRDCLPQVANAPQAA